MMQRIIAHWSSRQQAAADDDDDDRDLFCRRRRIEMSGFFFNDVSEMGDVGTNIDD
jgi:hypothetical protein